MQQVLIDDNQHVVQGQTLVILDPIDYQVTLDRAKAALDAASRQADTAEATSRVSTIGELDASLAHEIKQPIGAAVTNAEACLRLIDRCEPDLPEAREAASEMTKDARRAADIIERVRSLFREGSSTPQELGACRA